MDKTKPKPKILVWLANFLGPKLDKYRDKTEKDNSISPEIFLPETEEDLIWLLNKTPEDVLSREERRKLLYVLAFSQIKIRDLMRPLHEITFVQKDDFLGPLTLDRLYKSGSSFFPVLDGREKIVGILHTSALNSLEIKETDRAETFLDRRVYYMREDYSLAKALSAFLRTNSSIFLIINSAGKTVGLITLESIFRQLIGRPLEDNFSADEDIVSVMRRV